MAYSDEHHGKNPKGRRLIVIIVVLAGLAIAFGVAAYVGIASGEIENPFLANLFGLEESTTD